MQEDGRAAWKERDESVRDVTRHYWKQGPASSSAMATHCKASLVKEQGIRYDNDKFWT